VRGAATAKRSRGAGAGSVVSALIPCPPRAGLGTRAPAAAADSVSILTTTQEAGR